VTTVSKPPRVRKADSDKDSSNPPLTEDLWEKKKKNIGGNGAHIGSAFS